MESTYSFMIKYSKITVWQQNTNVFEKTPPHLVEVKLVEIETEILMMAQSLLQMQNFGLVQNYHFLFEMDPGA